MRARFVREYLIDLDVRAALARAGYRLAPDNTYGWKLLKMPVIAQAVREAMDARAARTLITADRVLAEIAAIAFSDIGQAARWRTRPAVAGADAGSDTDGQAACELELVDSADMAPATRRAIAKVRRYACGAVRVEMHDKLGALLLLGRHLGLFGNRKGGGAKDVLAEAREAENRRLDSWATQMSAEQRGRVRAAMQAVTDELKAKRPAARVGADGSGEAAAR